MRQKKLLLSLARGGAWRSNHHRAQRHGVTSGRAGDSGSISAPYSTCARGGPASTSGQAAYSWSQSVAAQSYEAACARTRTALQWKALVFSNSILCSTLGQRSCMAAWSPLALLMPTAHAHQQSRQPPSEAAACSTAPEEAPVPAEVSFFSAAKEEFWTCMRAGYLFLLFTPAVVAAPFSIGFGLFRAHWMDLVVWTLERAGPAFIKWGQWAATRPDLFPPDLCRALSRLQTAAPRHSFAHTRRIVETAFNRPLEEIYADFEERPVASGSIAQIHKAKLTVAGAAGGAFEPGKVVAVKVRHPGVTVLMQRDFTLMQRAARLSTMMPFLSDLHLDESIRQFGAPLKEQLDLAVEATHLARFNKNFKTWRNLSFPAPVYPLVTENVLVSNIQTETFEEGRLISSYVDKPTNKYSITLANIGLSGYLQMLLKDNFVHADLHPGNILVRLVDPNTLWGRIATFLKVNTSPHLVLLDVGMVAELDPGDQQNLVGFFKALTSQDGEALGHNILDFSDNQTCPDPDAFIRSMSTLFDGLDLESISERTSEIIAEMMEMIRQHQVNLKGVVSTVVVTTLVLEGWSTKLNPDIKIMDALKDILPMSFNERITRTVDKLMLSDLMMA